jgi:hypothetical protein
MWKEAALIYFKVLSRHMPRGTEENDEKRQSDWPVSGPRFESGPSEYEAVVVTTRPRR